MKFGQLEQSLQRMYSKRIYPKGLNLRTTRTSHEILWPSFVPQTSMCNSRLRLVRDVERKLGFSGDWTRPDAGIRTLKPAENLICSRVTKGTQEVHCQTWSTGSMHGTELPYQNNTIMQSSSREMQYFNQIGSFNCTFLSDVDFSRSSWTVPSAWLLVDTNLEYLGHWWRPQISNVQTDRWTPATS